MTTVMDLPEEMILEQCIDCMKHGVPIPPELQVWLKDRNLLYAVQNPIANYEPPQTDNPDSTS